jgi:hypothetical protein
MIQDIDTPELSKNWNMNDVLVRATVYDEGILALLYSTMTKPDGSTMDGLFPCNNGRTPPT